MKFPSKSRLPVCAVATFAATMCPVPAQAHLNSTGMGLIYDGMMNFLMSPEDLVPVLALAMLAGLHGASFGRRALFVLPAAWLMGGFLAINGSAKNGSVVVAAAWVLVLGGLLSTGANVSLRVTTALAALLGLYRGYLNGTGMGQFVNGAGTEPFAPSPRSASSRIRKQSN